MISKPSTAVGLLSLPDELLARIVAQTGPPGAVKLARCCKRLHSVVEDGSTWREMLLLSSYGEDLIASDNQPVQARQIAKQQFCRECRQIVSRTMLFYTGNICITCEYKDPSNEVYRIPMA